MLDETNTVPAPHAMAANLVDRRNLIHVFLARLTRFALLLGVFLAGLQPAAAYGVLTHNQLIDQAWASGIVPLLLSRYPSLTDEQLREAHAFAYGGCLIQDFGYYPFADSFIASLMHYVRSGDFVESLFITLTMRMSWLSLLARSPISSAIALGIRRPRIHPWRWCFPSSRPGMVLP